MPSRAGGGVITYVNVQLLYSFMQSNKNPSFFFLNHLHVVYVFAVNFAPVYMLFIQSAAFCTMSFLLDAAVMNVASEDFFTTFNKSTACSMGCIVI